MEDKSPDEPNNDTNEDRKLPEVDHQDTSPSSDQPQAAEPVEQEEQRVKRRRRMNMIHSRRKRERRKIEVEVLKEQVAVLTSKNDRLRSQNQELEVLLSQVHQIVGTNAQQQLLPPQQPQQAAMAQPLVMGQPAIAPMLPPNAAFQQHQLALQQILQYQLLSSLLAQQMGGQAMMQPTMASMQAFPGLQQQQQPDMPTAATTSPMDNTMGMLRLAMMPTSTHAVASSPHQPQQQIAMEQETRQQGSRHWEGNVHTKEATKRDTKHEEEDDDTSDREQI